MNYCKPLRFLIVHLFLFYCSVPNKEDTVLTEAAQIHNEAVALAIQLEEQLANDTTSQEDSVMLWREAIAEWEFNLVEVPGNENGKHHEHDHHNHGKQLTELTSDQILAIQKELKAQLDSIKLRINTKLP